MTILAFLFAIGILVAIHEYGHYQVARWCGVKVLRFAVGFGKPLLRWKSKNSDTEFTLCMLPLGGYVKMLDEREGEVAAEERHLAFNTQPVWKRFAIVAAGPIANLLLAIAIYSGMAWLGMQQAKPIVAQPPADSFAATAGLRSGDEVLQYKRSGAAQFDAATSLEQLNWQMMQAALDREDMDLVVRNTVSKESTSRTLTIPLHRLQTGQEADEGLANIIGIGRVWRAPVVEVVPASPADRAGVKDGDHVLRINNQPTTDAFMLHQTIGSASTAKQHWQIDRAGQVLDIYITPKIETQGEQKRATVGVYLRSPPATMVVRYGVLAGFVYGLRQTRDVSWLSLKGMAKMLTGQLSVKNLSGPLSIADFAGRSAQAGWAAYLGFLGLISVSLGVLNLLPIPVLDGGHLVYYMWEAITGKPLADIWQERMQKIGLLLLASMMALAMFNDISRYLG